MYFIESELSHLIDDYNKCDNPSIKELILLDINLLYEALTILQINEQKTNY